MSGRRHGDDRTPLPVAWLGSLSEAERVSLVDAIKVALTGPTRRPGDKDRWESLLARLQP